MHALALKKTPYVYLHTRTTAYTSVPPSDWHPKKLVECCFLFFATTSTSNSAATSATCVSEHFYVPVSTSARVDGRSNTPRKWRWQLAWNGHHAPRHDSYARSQSICLSEYSLRRDMMHMDSCGPAYNLSYYRVIRAGASPSKPIAASSVAPPAEEPEVPSNSARGRSPEGSSVASADHKVCRLQERPSGGRTDCTFHS